MPAKPKRRWPQRRWQAAPSPCRLQALREWSLPARLLRDWRRRRQWRRLSPRPFQPALPRSDPLPQRRRLKILAWLHRICRTSAHRTSSFQPCSPCRPLRLLWRRLCRRRVAWPQRRGHWNRCARLYQMQPCPTRRRCRARGCRMLPASHPSGAGRALSPGPYPGHDCRCCWQPHCCRPASRNCRFRRIDWNRPVRTSLVRPEKTRLPILLT